MIRLTWRLARPNIVSSVVLLALVVLFAVLTERAMTDYIRSSGLSTCLAANGRCDDLAMAFFVKFNTVINFYSWINLVPMLLGVFWGGPLIARELEQGTHRLAWTQSVGRRRWLVVKSGMFLLGALVMAAALTELMTWWFAPVERIHDDGQTTFGRLNPDVFDFRGIVPIAYTLFAFAVGLAAGAIVKRTVPAMGITLAVYLPLKVAMQSLRGHFMAPVKLSYAFGTSSPRLGRGDWILTHTVSKNGVALDRVQIPVACTGIADRAATEACVAARGVRFLDVYQPINRFWPFQFIESGIYVGLTAVVLGVAAWWIIRRLA